VTEKFKNSLLIVVPRHPERFNDVAALIKQRNLQMARRSCQESVTSETEVYLGDTMGELNLLYAVSDVAFVGGSLVPVGGHNMLEPAILSLPVISGPYLHNSVEISDLLLKAGGMVKINDSQELAQCVIQWFTSPQERKQIGMRGKEVVEKNRGAVNKIIELIALNMH